MAAEVAYYTYIYAKVERSKYQLVTSQTRSAILAGRFLGSAVAQVVISYNIMNYRQLNYLSLGCKMGLIGIRLACKHNFVFSPNSAVHFGCVGGAAALGQC